MTHGRQAVKWSCLESIWEGVTNMTPLQDYGHYEITQLVFFREQDHRPASRYVMKDLTVFIQSVLQEQNQ